MKYALLVILTLVLAGAALADEERPLSREPLEGKRGLAPIRGRRLGPARAQRDHDDSANWKREERDRDDRDDPSGGRGGRGGRGGGGDKGDSEDE